MSPRDLIAAFYVWCYHSPVLWVLRDTKLGIPLVQTVHLIGLTVLLGTTVAMNLRFLDLAYRELDPRSFLPQLWIWSRRGLWFTLAAGFVVFLPDPVRYVANISFRAKMAALALAILFQFTAFRAAVSSGKPGRTPCNLAISAISLTLWFSVGWCARAIAFVG